MKQVIKRLGIIGSSGGSALIAASRCLKEAKKNIDWVIVTDRKCGLEDWAIEHGHASHRLQYRDANTFSSEAYSTFQALDCNDVLLFYSRRVASPLIDKVCVSNIHPALLPAFTGLHAVEHALAAGVRILGATLHRVDAGLDTGLIIAQVATALPIGVTLKHAQHLSFLQKVWLTLVWFEQLSTQSKPDPVAKSCGSYISLAHPGIADEHLLTSYTNWLLQEEGMGTEDICV